MGADETSLVRSLREKLEKMEVELVRTKQAAAELVSPRSSRPSRATDEEMPMDEMAESRTVECTRRQMKEMKETVQRLRCQLSHQFHQSGGGGECSADERGNFLRELDQLQRQRISQDDEILRLHRELDLQSNAETSPRNGNHDELAARVEMLQRDKTRQLGEVEQLRKELKEAHTKLYASSAEVVSEGLQSEITNQQDEIKQLNKELKEARAELAVAPTPPRGDRSQSPGGVKASAGISVITGPSIHLGLQRIGRAVDDFLASGGFTKSLSLPANYQQLSEDELRLLNKIASIVSSASEAAEERNRSAIRTLEVDLEAARTKTRNRVAEKREVATELFDSRRRVSSLETELKGLQQSIVNRQVQEEEIFAGWSKANQAVEIQVAELQRELAEREEKEVQRSRSCKDEYQSLEKMLENVQAEKDDLAKRAEETEGVLEGTKALKVEIEELRLALTTKSEDEVQHSHHCEEAYKSTEEMLERVQKERDEAMGKVEESEEEHDKALRAIQRVLADMTMGKDTKVEELTGALTR